MQCPDPFPGLFGGQDFQQDEKKSKNPNIQPILLKLVPLRPKGKKNILVFGHSSQTYLQVRLRQL